MTFEQYEHSELLETEHRLRLQIESDHVSWGHHSTVQTSVGMLEKFSSPLTFPLQDMTVLVASMSGISDAIATDGIINYSLKYLLVSPFLSIYCHNDGLLLIQTLLKILFLYKKI